MGLLVTDLFFCPFSLRLRFPPLSDRKVQGMAFALAFSLRRLVQITVGVVFLGVLLGYLVSLKRRKKGASLINSE